MLNSVFTETNEDLSQELVSCPGDTSINANVSEQSSDSEIEQKDDDSTFVPDDHQEDASENAIEYGEQDADQDIENENDIDNPPAPPQKKGKLVVKAHRKKGVVRSQTQALSQIASGLKSLAEAQATRLKRQLEVDENRDNRMLKFRRSEVEKN